MFSRLPALSEVADGTEVLTDEPYQLLDWILESRTYTLKCCSTSVVRTYIRHNLFFAELRQYVLL